MIIKNKAWTTFRTCQYFMKYGVNNQRRRDANLPPGSYEITIFNDFLLLASRADSEWKI